jgi:peptidyl-tRNA hydrolase, PTH1 family
VGDAYAKGRQADYVLSPFNKQEMEEIVLNIDRAIDALLAFCTFGTALAMNQYN